jgi:hypothetical protein
MPADLMMAVSHALNVIHWQENLLEEDMPPEWMWPLNDELDEWFDAVDARRKEGSGHDDDLTDAPDMMTNELARGRR